MLNSEVWWRIDYRIKGLYTSFSKYTYSILGGGITFMIRILESLTLAKAIGIPIIIGLLILLVKVMADTLQ